MAHTGWTVTGQAPDQTDVRPGGKVETGTIVYFTTTEGNNGSAFLTDAQYARHEVTRRILQDKADRIDEVGRMVIGPQG